MIIRCKYNNNFITGHFYPLYFLKNKMDSDCLDLHFVSV